MDLHRRAGAGHGWGRCRGRRRQRGGLLEPGEPRVRPRLRLPASGHHQREHRERCPGEAQRPDPDLHRPRDDARRHQRGHTHEPHRNTGGRGLRVHLQAPGFRGRRRERQSRPQRQPDGARAQLRLFGPVPDDGDHLCGRRPHEHRPEHRRSADDPDPRQRDAPRSALRRSRFAIASTPSQAGRPIRRTSPRTRP